MHQSVSDLMTHNPYCVKQHNSLQDAHNLMREKNIRHIPVIDDDGSLVGMLTQKVMISEVMRILAKYGPQALERKEKQIVVREIMATDIATITKIQPLSEVAQFFVDNRHGCIPVIDDEQKLQGILTSSDFVRLAADLLSTT